MSQDIRLNAFTVARKCACRSWIIGKTASIEATGEKVAEHQQTEQHQSWDREAWIDANTTTEPVRTVLRKVS